MIQDNLRIRSLDVELGIRIPENFVYPTNPDQISSWIVLFSNLSKETSDPDKLRIYNAFWKLFKIARSKAKIKSFSCAEDGEITFVFTFRNLTNYSFFVKQVGHFTDNR